MHSEEWGMYAAAMQIQGVELTRLGDLFGCAVLVQAQRGL